MVLHAKRLRRRAIFAFLSGHVAVAALQTAEFATRPLVQGI